MQSVQYHAERKITAGHWPISNHFSKMANQNFSMVHSLCTHGQSNSSTVGKWPNISNFLFCTPVMASMSVYIASQFCCTNTCQVLGGSSIGHLSVYFYQLGMAE